MDLNTKNLMMAAGGDNQVNQPTAIVVAHYGSPYVSAYRWSSSGFGTKYANPSILPVDSTEAVAFSSNGDTVVVVGLANFAGNFNITAYRWSSSGFGSLVTDPTTFPSGRAYDVQFSKENDIIAVAHDGSPYISVYPWSSSGFGTKIANPSILPTGAAYGVAIEAANPSIPTLKYVAVSHANFPYISVYPYSQISGLGTKVSNPTETVGETGLDVDFSPRRNRISIAVNQNVLSYVWNGNFGIRSSIPLGFNPAGTSFRVKFSPTTGDYMAVAHTNSPRVSVYSVGVSGFDTNKFTNPASTPTGAAYGVAFPKTENYLAVAHENYPYITVYPWSPSGFGTKFANPSVDLPARATDVAFWP